MAATQELGAAWVANQVISIAGALNQISRQVSLVQAQATNINAATLLAQFPTAVASSTGGLGAADTTPNAAHPIDTRTTIGAEVSIAISLNNLASLLTYLEGVATCINGGSVAANGTAAAIVALTL